MPDLSLTRPKPALPSREPSSGWRRLLPNLVLFQIGWFAAVLGAANGLAGLGPLVIACVVGFHLYRATDPKHETGLMLAVLLVGLVFESLLALTDWVAYPGHDAALAPLWMVALWANFATTLNLALRQFRARAWALALLGLIGGPLAYWAGANLGAMIWLNSQAVLVFIALGWAALLPVLGRIALTFDGYRHGI